ncbi:MAG: SIS domain-containing protein [Myxococcales bacterium]|nr:SIS domain-containing protein [Myxococcales bacterium]
MSDFQDFVEDYYRRFADALQTMEKGSLPEILAVFEGVASRGGTIWVAGNGGSAAISDHTVCDTSKGTYVDGRPPIRSVSLAANGPMLTALGNDIGYDQVFRQQLYYYLKDEDAVLLVSSSGNSPNVLEACEFANQRGVPTIAFVGFGGGKLREMARHVVWVPIDNYGIVEDTHQSLIHCITQYLKVAAERAQASASS